MLIVTITLADRSNLLKEMVVEIIYVIYYIIKDNILFLDKRASYCPLKVVLGVSTWNCGSR